jgi:hypothetical protein
MKEAFIYKHRSGCWVAEASDTKEKLGGFHDTELQAIKAENDYGYIAK